MKFKIEEYHEPTKTIYFVLYKKNIFTNWRYIRNGSGLATHWRTKKGAESYINQEKKRLGKNENV